jgi:hypothetical protein
VILLTANLPAPLAFRPPLQRFQPRLIVHIPGDLIWIAQPGHSVAATRVWSVPADNFSKCLC